MRFASLTPFVAAALSAFGTTRADEPKAVYAHFMVGIVPNYTVDDWTKDMQAAQAIGIDGFALNCANPSTDGFTPDQLTNAYTAAAALNFKVFISFDFAYWNDGDADTITQYVSNYSALPAQATYAGGAIVSSFIGDSFNWQQVKDSLPNQKISAFPNFQDPNAIAGAQTGYDGALSWYAWPTSGNNVPIAGPITTEWDDKFVSGLGGKPYLAPVSPWFSTHFSNKNWVFICEEQITVRWDQMLQMKPALIELITWNDFGESHYISAPEPNHSDDGSSQWANGYDHSAWQTIAKPYIAAYKSGASSPTVDDESIVYWYRTTPKDTVCSGDSLGPPTGYDLLADVVFVTTLLTEAANLTVTSGSQSASTIEAPAGVNTFNFTMGVGKQSFGLSRGNDDQPFLGGDSEKDISDSCETYNYNAYVGQF